jgi:hypothetical protein
MWQLLQVVRPPAQGNIYVVSLEPGLHAEGQVLLTALPVAVPAIPSQWPGLGCCVSAVGGWVTEGVH